MLRLLTLRLGCIVALMLVLAACTQSTPTATPAPAPTISPAPVIPTPETRSVTPATPSPSPIASVTTTPERVAWLEQQAILLKTSLPDSPVDDLQPLGPVVDRSSMVALGESAYGMHEFFLMKQRLLQYLVEVHGFHVLALGATADDLVPINDYLVTGFGEPARVMANLPPPWNTSEMVEVMRWIRAFNTEHSTARVMLFGFDFQNQTKAMNTVEQYLDVVDPAASHLAASRYNCFRTVQADHFDYAQLPPTEQVQCQQSLEAVYDELNANRSAYTAVSITPAYERALHSARVVLQAEDWAAGRSGETRAPLRARYLAENIEWILAQSGGARLVLWGHNDDVSVNPGGRRNLGGLLRAQFGDAYKSIGLDFYWGSRRESSPPSQTLPPIEMLPDPPAGSVEALLHQVGLTRFMLVGRNLVSSPNFDWLNAPRPMHSIGLLFDASQADTYFRQVHLLDAFDMLVFLRGDSAAWPLSANLGYGPSNTNLPFPTQLVNPDFEQGLAGWHLTQNVSDTLVVTDSVVRHGGLRSVRLDSAGSDLGLNQQIRLDAYRGQRVRFSAFLKTDGVESRAGLRMDARSVEFPTEHFEDMAHRPVRGTQDWQPYAIVFDVTDDMDLAILGAELVGRGRMWIDDVRFEVVNRTVPLTYLQGWPDRLANFGFEEGEQGWEFEGNYPSSERVFVGVDHQVSHGGHASGTLNFRTLNPQVGGIRQSLKAEAYRGQRMRLSAYFKSEAATTPVLALNVESRNHTLGVIASAGLAGTHDWYLNQLLYDMPDDADTVTISVVNHQGQLWVDDVQFAAVD